MMFNNGFVAGVCGGTPCDKQNKEMKTLIHKAHPQIRITAPEIIRWFTDFYVVKAEAGKRKGRILVVKSKDWALVEEEPEKIYYKMLDNKANCPFDKGDCRYCTVQFCGAREENHIETRSTAEIVDCSPEKHPDKFTDFEWIVGNLMFRGCDLDGMTDGEDDNGTITKLIKDRAAEMMELLERELDPNAEPVGLDLVKKIISTYKSIVHREGEAAIEWYMDDNNTGISYKEMTPEEIYKEVYKNINK